MSRRILIIDNQQAQFGTIRDKLREAKYIVFPEVEDFERINDYARIYLNRRYPLERRERTFLLLTEYIKQKKIELFIIDYKLTGCHDGLTGIHLAVTLEVNFANIPIIFLSRTPSNEEEVIEGMKSLKNKNSVWVNKGYAGLHLTEKSFFEKNILSKIPELLGKPPVQIYIEKIHGLNRIKLYEDYIEKLNKIRQKLEETGEIDSVHKDIIDELHRSPAQEEAYLRRLFSKINI